MIYDFVNDITGKTVELHYSMANVPSIGEVIEHEGEKLRRIACCQVDAGIDAKVHGYPYVSSSLPRNLKGCDTNRQGKPIVTSRRHEREVISRHGYSRD